MFYRDFMSKYRPVYAPDGVGGGDGAAAAAPAGEAAPAADAGAAPGAAPAEAATPATQESGAAPAEAAPQSSPSLLETAAGKPKAEAEATPAADAGAAKDDPAPAEAAKPDGEATKPEGEKPADDAAKPKDAAEADPDKKDATAEIPPPAPIKYEAFKIPETIKLDDKKLAEFSELAGAAQVNQETAQKLVDLYVADAQQMAQDLRAEQRRTWDTLNDTWKSELRADPTIGGNRLETSLSIAKAVIEEYGGSAEQVQELLAHTSNNGMGNFPGFVRLLHNIGTKLNVFEDSIVPANPQSPKAQKSPGNRGWYDQGKGAATS